MTESYNGVTFTRNARGGLVAPKPGGYERDWGRRYGLKGR